MKHRLPFLVSVALLLFPLTARVGSAAQQEQQLQQMHEPAPAHATRIVVKYRATVDDCVHCLLENGQSMAAATGSDSLDHLHGRFGVTGARSLFLPAHTLRGGRGKTFRDRVEATRQRFPVRSARVHPGALTPDLSRIYVLNLEEGTDVHEAAREYARDADVEYAHPDFEVSADFVPNDLFFSSAGTWGQSYPDLWGLHTTQAELAWDTSIGTGAIVAVIDTGVDPAHPDVSANMWTNLGEIDGNGLDDDGNGFVDDVQGWDFNEGDAEPDDEHGHGTHVAGTAAGVGDNGLGVVGMAWGARVMPVKGLSDFGSGSEADLAEAIVYAAENGADVLNNSWGGNHAPGQVMLDAVATATSLGAVVVASSGNNGGSVDAHSPSSIAEVIAVGASDPDGGIAGFSNFGQALSVAAPGVDVLSLLGPASTRLESRPKVGDDYVRLSGTSMAAPHVSGLAAVILAAMPGLTTEQVRWQLEMNADQPGYVGWESRPWNPFYGFGRINAARSFDPVGTLTRLRSPVIELHEFAGVVRPDAANVDLSFTTFSSVPWTASAPAWLTPATGSGAGNANISLDVDTTSLVPGSFAADIAVDAPTADDGGSSVPAILHLHADQRIGDDIFLLDTDARFPAAASDGLGTVVFYRATPNVNYSVHIDGAGNAGPTIVDYVSSRGHPSRNDIATDGRSYLSVWVEADIERDWILVQRLSGTGEPLDLEPLLLQQKKLGYAKFLRNAEVAFDGEAYTVIWSLITDNVDRIYAQQVGADGSIRGKPRIIHKERRIASGTGRSIDIACNQGECLVAYRVSSEDKDGDGDGDVPDRIMGVRVVGNRPVDEPREILVAEPGSDVRLYEVVANGSGYFLLGRRDGICGGLFTTCDGDIIGVRIDSDGVPLDPGGILLTPTLPAHLKPVPHSVVFDGTSYLVTVQLPLTRTGMWTPSALFGIHVGLDGSLLGTEDPGSLLLPGGVHPPSDIVVTREHAVHVWRQIDGEGDDEVRSVRAQRILSTSPPSVPAHAVGAIGPQAASEGHKLSFTVEAPGLDPATTTFSASNLPPGAVFDPYFRTFQWIPLGNEVGAYSFVHFEAADGTQTLSEDISITVAEGRLSVSGQTRTESGDPIPGAAVKLRGRGAKRNGFSGADGRYLFDGLVPGPYTVRLDKPTKKEYRAKGTKVFLVDVDATVDLILSPR